MSALTTLRPTTRRRLGRVSSYVLALVVVVFVYFAANWEVLGTQFANMAVAAKMWPSVITTAVVNTLVYTGVSFAGGLILAIVFAVMKLGGGPLGWFATAYIELFRGVPALLTIFTMAYIVPVAFPGARISGIWAGVIGLIFVTSAYTAEIIRAGIQAVPVGQREAARSLGLSSLQTMTWVVLPQGMRIVIPPLTNELVMLLKDTSLLYIAGMQLMEKDLSTFARDLASQNMNATPMIVVAILYLIITIPLTMLAGLLEKKLDPRR